MQCPSNSQDVIGNSRRAWEHSVGSGTAPGSISGIPGIPVCFTGRAQCFLGSLQQLPCSPGCGWAAEHRAHPCHQLFVVSPERPILGYHTRHFPAGCMAVPFLQWNTSEKASKFCNEPITLDKEKGLTYMEIAVLGNRKWFGASELDCSSEYGML